MPLNSSRSSRAIALLGATIAVAVHAQMESSETIELAPFVVTADGAQSILHITARDLEQRQAIDLEDALSLDPSITVGGSTGIAQKIYVRNLGEELLNVSIDGASQSGSLFHHIGRVLLEPELLKQIEVQPGIGNAADGPGALGGAIRFVTKDPTDLLHASEKAGALLKYGYFSNTRGWKASATGFGRANDHLTGLVSLVSSEHEEIEDGDGRRLRGSDTRQNVVLGKVVSTFGDGQTARFGFEYLDEVGNKLRRPEWGPSPANPMFYMEANRRTATFGYEANPTSADWLDLRFNLNHSSADILQIAAFGPYTGEITGTQFDLRNTQRAGTHTLVYGVDYRRDEVTAGPQTAPETHSEDGYVTGLFLQDDIAVTSDLTLHAGARYDVYRLEDRQRQKFSHEGFSPNAGFTYAFTPRFSVNGSAATAFRGPGINDAFRIDLSQNDPNLDGEEAQNYELRFLYRDGRWQLEAGAYASRIDNLITNTLPWSRVYTNAGELKTDGFFARATYALPRAHFSLQYNHADTTLNGQTATRYQYSSLVSRIGDTWVGDISWRPLDQLNLGWNARLVEGIDGILVPFDITGVPNSRINKPGYVTHDFYLRWTPTFARALTFDLTIKNVFDKTYRSHGSLEDMTAFPGFAGVVGAAEPGRDLRLSATLRF